MVDSDTTLDLSQKAEKDYLKGEDRALFSGAQ